MLGLDNTLVNIVPHDSEWNLEYAKEAERLKQLLGDYALDIQHVGSTSIPEIEAKPIIDIAVAVKDIETLYTLIPILEKAGYNVKNSIVESQRLLAIKGDPKNRTHYIHLEVKDGEYWKNHILFRDYLIKHLELAKEYEKIKINAYKLFKDNRIKYSDFKNSFIRKVVNQAIQELNDK